MANTRDFVLQTLLQRHNCTINELAEVVQINPISVRHHIAKLESAGFVDSREERHGVGRPRRIYFLTDMGMEQFPSRYINLSIRLLEVMKDKLPKKDVEMILGELAKDIISDHATKLKNTGLNLDQKVRLAEQLLTEEGYSIEIEKDKEGYHIKEISCPYMHVSADHREVCIVDEVLISSILEAPIEQTQCIHDGDPYCSFLVKPINEANIQVME